MENIKKIIESHMPSKAELLSFHYNPRSSFIKIVIDSREEITIDDTAILARDIKNDDSIVSNFPEGIRLEVGTPGVGSKLEKAFQFEKNIGRKIELEYYDGNEIIKKTCLLKSVGENSIIVVKNNKIDDISFNDLHSAKIKVSFD
tara:strand:+ start:1361 stop:1795 length:435 start_codon:yes stop_codon:yes gene_type:complete